MARKGKGRRRGNLTPYQGKHRTFGYFNCLECEKHWRSAYSWANTAQQCDECMIDVYPHTQFPLEEGWTRGKMKIRHREDLCGMCRQLGRSCISDDELDELCPKRRRRRNKRK